MRLHNRRESQKPEITKKMVYIKSTLFTYRDGILRISVEPSRRYLEVDLTRYERIPRGFEKIGGLILTEREMMVTIKKHIEPESINCIDDVTLGGRSLLQGTSPYMLFFHMKTFSCKLIFTHPQ